MRKDELLEKVQASLDRLNWVVGEVRNINKCLKEGLQKVMRLMRRLSSAKEVTKNVPSRRPFPPSPKSLILK